MGKGKPIVCCRVPQELLDEMRLTIVRRNTWTKRQPWKEADFIKAAIHELLRKMKASRRRRAKCCESDSEG
jgi:hypothetical protein